MGAGTGPAGGTGSGFPPPASPAPRSRSSAPSAALAKSPVKGFLDRSGQDALPLVLIDDEVALAGRYPQRAELARWLGVAPEAPASVPPAPGSCGPRSGCC
uniref:arsenic metallochaperone ArsD family protein n=1 Tax=Paracoccus methylutens TaxID=135742 RepID=UPI00156458CF